MYANNSALVLPEGEEGKAISCKADISDPVFTASISSDHHTERPDHPFFWYTNCAGELASFRTDHLLHVLGHDPNNSSIVDFLNSDQGFYLRLVKEFIDGKEDEEPVETLVLTVERMSRLLDPGVPEAELIQLLEDLEFWKYEFIMGELALTVPSPHLVDDPLQAALSNVMRRPTTKGVTRESCSTPHTLYRSAGLQENSDADVVHVSARVKGSSPAR